MKYTLPSGEHRDIDNKFNIGDIVQIGLYTGRIIKIIVTMTNLRYEILLTGNVTTIADEHNIMKG